jgi:hypothetical protein
MTQTRPAQRETPEPLDPTGIHPHDREAEQATLSCCLLDATGATLDLVRAIPLGPEDFFPEPHQILFRAMLALRTAAQPIDLVTVGGWLRDHGRYEQIGAGYLVETLNAAPAAAHWQAYASTVRRKAVQRRGLEILKLGAAELALANGTSPALVKHYAEQLAALEGPEPVEEYESLTGADLATDEPPLSYLVEALGLVDGGGPPHMIAGAGYSGKTMLAQDLLLCLASGHPVWGAYGVGGPRRVIHVDMEQGRKLTKLRYKRLAFAKGIALEGVGDALRVIIHPKNLRLTPAHWKRWRSLMDGRDAMVVDSLRVAAAGLDENSSEFRESLDMLGALSNETGCRVFPIHHLRKSQPDSEGMMQEMLRGSSAIFEALDCCLMLRKQDQEAVVVHQTKARSHGEDAPPFSIRITDVPGPNGQRKWGLRVSVAGIELVHQQREEAKRQRELAAERATIARIEASLREHPGQTADELAMRTKLRKQAVIRVLLDFAGIIVESRASDGGRPAKTYRLT